MVKQTDNQLVVKYFDLIDEFIKIRSCTEEVLEEISRAPVSNKASYRRSIVVHKHYG